MTGRVAITLLGTLVLGVNVLVWNAVAAHKSCPKLCRDIHTACITDAKLFYPCKDVPKAAKKTCRQGLKAAKATCRDDYKATIAKCKASASTTTCSPSGAFVGPN